MNRIAFLLTLLSAFVISCSGETEPKDTEALRDTIKKAESLYVFEGLPHQGFESSLLETEKAREDTTKIAGYPFYTPKVRVEGEAESQLKEFIADSGNFTKFEGEKLCGGFHPDFAVEWSDGAKSYSVLFCFGCGEVLVVDGKGATRYDFNLVDDLRKILSTYNSKRPEEKLD